MADELSSHKAMKITRKSHRGILRSVAADDAQWTRSELYSLYDPSNSPLRSLTDGPSPTCAVPMVDAAMLSAYKNKSVHPEIMDNLSKVSHSFDINNDQLRHIQMAAAEARAAGNGDGDSVTRMNNHLEAAGFGAGSGMSIPSAITNAFQ